MDETGWIMKKARRGARYFEDTAGQIVAKVCNKCIETKALVDFHTEKRGIGGKTATCAECINKSMREYKSNNRDKTREQFKRYYAENREKIKETRAKRSEEYRDEINGYYRDYYKENREKILESKRKWRDDNPDKQRECVKDWGRRNPERVSLTHSRRRARKAALPDDFTLQQMDETLAYFDGGCALTGDTDNVHWDHVIPISLGLGGTTSSNMIPLRGDINQSKNSSNIFEWFDRNKSRFNLSQGSFDKLIAFIAEKNGMSEEDYRSFYFAQFEENNDASAS
jgi:hypothetical protein